MKRIALFPGSFDPFTKGHEVIVHKALSLFDEVIIAIGINSTKTSMFDTEKRVAHINSLFAGKASVRVLTYQKLTVDLCKDLGADFIVRGLRDAKDFDYEKTIAHMNHEMAPVETVFFLTDTKYAPINSTVVREIYRNKGNIDPFVSHASLLV
jgi:pantetheine-phosphate adenylyltransferase